MWHYPSKLIAISLGIIWVVVIASVMAVGTAVPAGAAIRGISKAQCNADKAVGTIRYISPFGFDASGGIIDVFVAQKLGFFKQMCLTTSITAAAFDGNELVSSGRAQVTNIGGAATMIEVASNGANLVGVATMANTSDTAIDTQKTITTLKELEGKRLGYYTSLEVSLQVMLAKAGVILKKVTEVSMTNYTPEVLTEGEVNGLTVYQSDQSLTLRTEGKPFNQFTPAKYGVKGTYDVQMFNGTFLKRHRKVVAEWMRADLRAITYCISHASKCVDIEHQYAAAAHATSAFPLAHELQEWKFESRLIAKNTLAGRGIGVETYAQWTSQANELKQYHVVKTVSSLKKVENVTVVASLYRGKRLIWP